MPQNRIVVFSNGIADVQRGYVVRGDAPTRISIPVRQDHVGDVLASLNVFGTVRLSSPPSYRPVNQNDGTLTLETKNVLEGLADQLSGAQAAIDTAAGVVEGVVVGLHGEPEGKPAERTYIKSLVVLGTSGFVRVPLRDITALRFADAGVRDEIDKALKRNFQRIKPHSTFVELTLTTPETETEAVLQYTLPAAAWKISYRLLGKGDGSYELHGFAVVDNNTDEDWNDFRLAVVTGEPITFSTDLAESKTPQRRRVNVVRSDAFGAVEIEDGEHVVMVAGPAAGAPAGGGAAMGKLRKAAGSASVASKSFAYRDAASMDFMEVQADLPKATSREIGDFCVFEADEPVTIGANRSAIVPVFQTALAETRSILHYNESNHAERSFRTVQFKNETGHPLGRGVCTVFEGGTYAGSCVLPASVVGEQTLLAHALESGVKIRRKYVSGRDTVIGLQLSQGACSIRRMHEKTYSYRVENLKDEAFELLVDHEEGLTSPKRRAVVKRADGEQSLDPSEKLKSGVRYVVRLAPYETFEVVVHESRVETAVVRFVVGEGAKEELKTAYLQETLIASNGPLSQHAGLTRCLELQKELDAKKQEVADAVGETARLAERQERLRKNIAVGGQDAQTAQWRVDLGKAENRILEIDEQFVPRLREEERTIRNQLRTELQALSAEWASESTIVT